MSPSDRRSAYIGCAGFSLIEVLVATTILAAGVSTAAGLALSSGRALVLAQRHSMATLLARAKVEQIRSLAWTRDADLVAVSDLTTRLAASPVALGGTGLGTSSGGTLESNVPGYCDYLDARGVWVGEGASPPAAALWVRRWSIAPVVSDMPDLLRIEVLVEPLSIAMRPSSSGSRQVEGARLVAIRARRSR